jgi:hypothetical protein
VLDLRQKHSFALYSVEQLRTYSEEIVAGEKIHFCAHATDLMR